MTGIIYTQANYYPVGNAVTCRFAFLTRGLTQAEEATFEATGTLPTGVGADQYQAFFEYYIDDGPTQTLTVAHESPGVYSTVVVAEVPGIYYYRGYAQNQAGVTIASTDKRRFVIEPFE